VITITDTITMITIAIITIAIITMAIITIAIITIAIIPSPIITIPIITITIITIAIITITIVNICYHHDQPQTKCPHIRPQSVGRGQQILLENLIWRSALPKLQLSTFTAEWKAAIVNTMNMRHCETSLQWPS
jgi:hypothetical protein